MEPKSLGPNCAPGDVVWWKTFGGAYFIGILKEWDNGTAIVRMNDGTVKAVQG